MILEKIISGGQTGADRAALDWAIANGILHGGWCPRGRKAEDGRIDLRYQLGETPSADYAQRTEWNVRDSDGTVIFSLNKSLGGGSLLTKNFTHLYHKPCLHIVQAISEDDSPLKLGHFLLENHIKVLNVAGTRASEESEIYQFVWQKLTLLATTTPDSG